MTSLTQYSTVIKTDNVRNNIEHSLSVNNVKQNNLIVKRVIVFNLFIVLSEGDGEIEKIDDNTKNH